RVVSDRARDLTWTLRPLDESVTEVPAVAVSHYDPKAGKFVTARSQPIPLKVTNSGQSGDAPAAAAKEEETGDEEAEASPFAVILAVENRIAPWAGVVVGACVTGLGLAWGSRRTWRHLARRRSLPRPDRQAAPDARAALRRPGLSVIELRQIVQDFLRR